MARCRTTPLYATSLPAVRLILLSFTAGTPDTTYANFVQGDVLEFSNVTSYCMPVAGILIVFCAARSATETTAALASVPLNVALIPTKETGPSYV